MNNDKIFSLKNQTIFLHTPPYSVDICRVRKKILLTASTTYKQYKQMAAIVYSALFLTR